MQLVSTQPFFILLFAIKYRCSNFVKAHPAARRSVLGNIRIDIASALDSLTKETKNYEYSAIFLHCPKPPPSRHTDPERISLICPADFLSFPLLYFPEQEKRVNRPWRTPGG